MIETAIRVDQLEQDQLIKEMSARFIGSVAVEHAKASEQTDNLNTVSLYSRLPGARMGNPEDIAAVYANAKTAVIEAIYIIGHITKVKGEISDHGSVVQHGQSLLDVNKNALRYFNKPIAYKKRLEAETLNTHRIENYIQTGMLEDNWLFIASLYPDDMSDEQATNCGFFVDTKTNVLQAVSTHKGEYLLESAFLQGEKNHSDRSDIDIIKLLYKSLGFDVSNMTVTQLLATPILIPKTKMPNGLVDILKLQDQLHGNSFFGQINVEIGDYNQYSKMCLEREKNLEPITVQAVTELLLSDNISDPLSATLNLYEIVKKIVLKHTIYDATIRSDTFGKKAATYIDSARHYLNQGDQLSSDLMLSQALKYAVVSMCGIGSSFKEAKNESSLLDNLENQEDFVDSKTKQVRCVNKNCRQYVHLKDVIQKTSWRCPKCQYEVEVCSGKIINSGTVENRQLISNQNIFKRQEESVKLSKALFKLAA